MPNLQSELATRVFFVTQKEIWKINVQKDGERKSFYSKLPGKRGQKDCAAKAAAWLLSDSPLSLSDKTTVDDLFELYLKDKALETTDTYNIANRYKNHIAPVIGRIRISRLTKQDLKRVISTAHHEHHLSKKTLLTFVQTLEPTILKFPPVRHHQIKNLSTLFHSISFSHIRKCFTTVLSVRTV